jgi:hypothetical protein
MKYRLSIILSFVTSLIVAGCFLKPYPEPRFDGPANIFKYDGVYYALFPRTFELFFSCGGGCLDSMCRVNLNKAVISDNEKVFRESYYKAVVESAEKIHPDSTAYVTEIPGEYMIVKPVSRKEYLRRMRKEYKTSISWDRQYLGFVNDKNDTILVINMIDPGLFSRANLGSDWMLGADAALEHLYTITFNLSNHSITYNLCNAIKSK